MFRVGRFVTVFTAAALVQFLAGTSAPATAADAPHRLAAISGPVTLVSTTAGGEKGNAFSDGASLSSSGNLVAFTSDATNFGADNGFSDIYVKDLASGELTLASTSDTGEEGDRESFQATLSPDGSVVAFSSRAGNLDPEDGNNNIMDVFAKDLSTGDLTIVSTSDTGKPGNGDALSPSPSRSGDLVAFQTDANTLDPGDTDSASDVYLKDLRTGDLTLESTNRSGVKGNSESFSPDLTPSGARLAFVSAATNLVAKDKDIAFDVYVKVLATGKLFLASTSDAGVKGDFGGENPSLSSGGTKVAFDSDSKNLDPGDTSRDTDVYVKDPTTGDLVLASTNDDGVKANGFSERPALSGNGRRVAFVSDATNLDPADTDNDWDVYVKDLVTGDVSLATTSSDGVKGGEDANQQFPSISGKGRRVAFHTEQQLDPGDPDDVPDVYVKDPILCTTMGTPGNDVMVGTGGDDVMCGAGGIDVMDGAGGDDVLFGGGDDDFILGGPGNDRIDGGPGTDTADYSASDGAVAIDLSTSSGAGGDADGDLLAAVEAVVGSPFDDTLTGDDADNFFVGVGGRRRHRRRRRHGHGELRHLRNGRDREPRQGHRQGRRRRGRRPDGDRERRGHRVRRRPHRRRQPQPVAGRRRERRPQRQGRERHPARAGRNRLLRRGRRHRHVRHRSGRVRHAVRAIGGNHASTGSGHGDVGRDRLRPRARERVRGDVRRAPRLDLRAHHARVDDRRRREGELLELRGRHLVVG